MGCTITFSQDWQWLNPLPTGNKLNCVRFIDDNTGFAVGDCGTILKTTDGGETWTLKAVESSFMLRSVFFTDANTGYIVGGQFTYDFPDYDGIILKTSDAGENWIIQPLIENTFLHGVYFTDNNTGYAVGFDILNLYPKILKTTNGGIEWITQNIQNSISNSLNSVFFTDYNTGYVVGGSWGAYGDEIGRIIKTTDGGENWILQFEHDNSDLASVFFTNDNTGYAVGSVSSGGGLILKTIDGGISWTDQPVNSGLYCIYFAGENTGYAGGYNGTILKTVDGGLNWIGQNSGISSTLFSVYFHDEYTGYAVGAGWNWIYGSSEDGAVILKTTNGGENWTDQILGTKESFSSVFFLNEDMGYVATGNYYPQIPGAILKTTDAGANWICQISGIPDGITSLYFIDDYIGYALGLSTFLKTIDGGSNWIYLNNTSGSSIFFKDTYTGYCVGADIQKTTDGGATWTTKYTGSNIWLYSVFFPDDSTGYAVGAEIILKTIDGGENWTVQTIPQYAGVLKSVHFIDSNTGCAVGEWGVGILKTIDGGENWIIQSYVGYFLNSVYFIDENQGYAFGGQGPGIYGYFHGGVILKTIDGGLNWTRNHISGTLNSGSFIGDNIIYAVGLGGTIVKTTTGGTTGIDEFENVSTYKHLVIFPNPSNDKITISSPAITGNTLLSIFNVSGDKVLERQLTDNESPISISALPRGVYFVRVQNEKMVEVGKMVKMVKE